MRILYLSQVVPYPADAGAKIRIYHVLQYLAAAGHEVTLVAFRRENDSEEAIAHLRQYCREVHTVLMQRSARQDAQHLATSILRGMPFLIARDQVEEMYRLVQTLTHTQHFDAVHADQLWMAQYALATRRQPGAQQPGKLVLDQHNAMFLIPQRLSASLSNPLKRAILHREARQLAAYERTTCQQFDAVTWVSEEDRQAVFNSAANGHRLSATARHTVIPICVDPDSKPPISRKANACRVTFLGGLHWPPNAEGVTWFWEDVWPTVRRTAPEAILTVIGKDPPPPLAHAADSDPTIHVTGYVDDPLPYLQETAAFIVPLSAGGGMRVKIIDAWSWALPIVSTRIGAEGVRYEDGHNLLIADQAHDFAAAIMRLLQQPQLAGALAGNGRATVTEHYDWRAVYRAWDAIYDTSTL
ncbi:MAG TPA: glycosyltransferase family 4 protein [Candidatus Sulfomarinibacteraceae bacterium]|nr:glycosyltransferase family 4 protein [Candidatus Sulfomarinibacteraceae bacterium]